MLLYLSPRIVVCIVHISFFYLFAHLRYVVVLFYVFMVLNHIKTDLRINHETQIKTFQQRDLGLC